MNKQLELEEIIIGILLRNPKLILSESLDERWFTHLRRPIQVMLRLAANGIDIDPIFLADELGKGSLADVVRWQRDTIGAASNYTKYLDRLKDDFKQSGIKSALERALTEINNGRKSEDVLSGLYSDAQFVHNYGGKKYSYTAMESTDIFIDHLAVVEDARQHGGLGIKTGIRKLDDYTGGMHPSDLIIVGARPAVGKTAFCTTVLLHVAKQGKKVGFISTEMSVTQNMERISSMVSTVSAKKIREADLDDDEYSKLIASTSKIREFPFFICDKSRMTVSEVSMQCRSWLLSFGLDFIVIDYLTRIKPDKSTGNQNIDVADVVTGIKNIARDLNIPVMCLAQLNRNIENRADKRPMISDIRDSGVIEQEADGIWMLHRPGNGSAEVIVEKNRHGESGKGVLCNFFPEIMKWEQA